MPAPTHDPNLAAQVRQLLETLPEQRLPITYQQVAEALGLTPPRTIQRVALALEALMHEDAEAGRPLIAALVISRRGALPTQGFFDLAVALGRFPADPGRHEEAYQEEFRGAVAVRGKPGG